MNDTTAKTTDNAAGKGTPQGDTAHDRAARALDHARHKAHDAADASRERARAAVTSLENNPVGLVVGGLAVGALVAAVLPRSERERELLAPVGKKVGIAATAALAAAKAAGRDELESRGLTADAARGQARSLVDGVLKAASAAGKAGAEAGRDRAKSAG